MHRCLGKNSHNQQEPESQKIEPLLEELCRGENKGLLVTAQRRTGSHRRRRRKEAASDEASGHWTLSPEHKVPMSWEFSILLMFPIVLKLPLQNTEGSD